MHPFREGNTRTLVMLMTLFVEKHGYYFDKDLLAASAGYVRDSLVMATIDQYSEFEYLECILLDAVCTEPVETEENQIMDKTSSKYKKYQKETYIPVPHTVYTDD